jgi:biotin operon repressor
MIDHGFHGPPTDKQLEALKFVLDSMRRGEPVSAGQIARELKLTRRAVVCRIDGLKLRGYVEVREGHQWGIVVVKDEQGRRITGWQELTE